jgi:hypothetical protein
MTGYSTFYCYYFWFLVDLGFIVDEYKEMSVFAPMIEVNFNEFITTFMEERIKAKEEKNDGLSEVYKIILNSSYGKDGMNTAKYSNIAAQNRNMTLFKQF